MYKGRDRESGRLVALKFLSESLAEDPVIRRRFHREARAAAALEHPNIGAIHGVEEQDGRLFLVMPSTVAARSRRGSPGDRSRSPTPFPVPSRSPRDWAWRTVGHHPPRHQTRQPRLRGRRHSQDPRLRHREGRRGEAHPHRVGAGYAGLHESRAGHRRDRGPSNRPLGPGRGPVRDAGRATTVLRALHRAALPRSPRRGDSAGAGHPPRGAGAGPDVVSRLLQREPHKRYPDAQAAAAALRD